MSGVLDNVSDDRPIDELLWNEVRVAMFERDRGDYADLPHRELLRTLLEHFEKTYWVSTL
jgi:hypothetical protein